jgi:hypothetical protein
MMRPGAIGLAVLCVCTALGTVHGVPLNMMTIQQKIALEQAQLGTKIAAAHHLNTGSKSVAVSAMKAALARKAGMVQAKAKNFKLPSAGTKPEGWRPGMIPVKVQGQTQWKMVGALDESRVASASTHVTVTDDQLAELARAHEEEVMGVDEDSDSEEGGGAGESEECEHICKMCTPKTKKECDECDECEIHQIEHKESKLAGQMPAKFDDDAAAHIFDKIKQQQIKTLAASPMPKDQNKLKKVQARPDVKELSLLGFHLQIPRDGEKDLEKIELLEREAEEGHIPPEEAEHSIAMVKAKWKNEDPAADQEEMIEGQEPDEDVDAEHAREAMEVEEARKKMEHDKLRYAKAADWKAKQKAKLMAVGPPLRGSVLLSVLWSLHRASQFVRL